MDFRTFCCRTSLILVCAIFSFACSATKSAESKVEQLIEAIQKRDFRTVIDSTAYFQSQINNIKEQNPSVLHSKLIKEYYDQKTSALSANAGFWEDYAQSLTGMAGDPTKNIRMAIMFLPSTCKWRIAESKAQKVEDSVANGPHTRITVYVGVNYTTLESSPRLDNRFLKETLLEFTVQGETQRVVDVIRLQKGDVYWPDTPQPSEAAEHPNDTCSKEVSTRSTGAVGETSFTITNRRAVTLTVYWLNYEGKRQKWFELQAGETRKQDTFTTHPWLVADPTGQCLRIFNAPATIMID